MYKTAHGYVFYFLFYYFFLFIYFFFFFWGGGGGRGLGGGGFKLVTNLKETKEAKSKLHYGLPAWAGYRGPGHCCQECRFRILSLV